MYIEAFGGTLGSRKTKYRGMDKRLYTWQASSAVAERAIRQMRPFFRTKAEEADLALEFRATFRPQFGDRSRMPEEVVNKRREIGEKMKLVRKLKRVP